jgi:type VI secretion system lysozyme-like protein
VPVQANSLLERLSMGRRGYAPSRQVDSLTLLTSVQRNLNRIFNTNQGSSLARPDYGFPDFNRIIANFPDAIPWLTAILTEQIRMFEPRLAAAQVRFVPDEANGPTKGAVSLNFIITAQLVQSDNAVIRFNTVFDDRKFQVSA